MTALPSDSEVCSAAKDLFCATASCDRTARWNALVPTDAQGPMPLPQGQKHVTHVPTLEAREIVEFVLDIEGLIEDRCSSPERRIRMMLMGYCHIMETELMPTLIWNQLRLLHGVPPAWCFTRTTKSGITQTCWLPRRNTRKLPT
jgi:hypothetical protein